MSTLGLTRAIALEHLRDTSYSMWSLILPPAAYVVAVLFLGNADPARAAAILSITLLGTTCTAGCISFPLGLRALEDQGLLRALRLRPLRPGALVASATTADTAMCTAACALVLAAGVVLGAPVRAEPLRWVVGSLLAVAMGMALGGAIWSTAASFLSIKNYGNIALIPYLLGAGAFFRLPGFLDKIGSVLPSYQIHRLYTTGDLRAAIVPAVWAAALAGFAAVRSRRRRADA